jgi:hypothetical protein
MLTIKVDTKAVEKMLANVKNGAARVARDALNDTADHVRAAAVRDIRGKWNVQAGELRKRIKINPRATINRLQALVQADGEPIPLTAFKARQIRKGVSVAIVKGKRTLIRHGFIATMKSGHRGVFVRAGRQRLPIIERKAITIPSQWNQRIAEHQRAGQAYLEKRLQSRLQRLLETGK